MLPVPITLQPSPPAVVVAAAPRPSFEQRLFQALSALRRSETGAALADEARRLEVRFKPVQGGMWYVDGENTVGVGEDYLGWPDWQFAALLSHELEHAVQRGRGLTGEKARGYREWGAFLVQCRVWVELGAPSRDEDWARNARNSRDMWAWVRHPQAPLDAIALRGGLTFPEHAAGRAYLESVRSDEARWRKGRALPSDRDSGEAAAFVLEQARRSAGGRVR